MDNEYNTLGSLLGGAIQAMATRPQKTSTFTNTTSTSTPYALQDMIAARDSIGLSTKKLNDALKARESVGYSILNSLSGIPQQQGAGSWLTDFARAFGGSAVSPTNAAVDRAQQVYEAELKDLANRLAYDKAMGETTTQRQSQTMGYTPMEYSAAGAKGSSGVGGSSEKVPFTSAADWDYWIKNWDEDRQTEGAYHAQSGLGRWASNFAVGKKTGTATENAARQDFNTFVGKDILMMARDALRGTGPITDFEDKKYSAWINDSKQDPVALKDTFVRIVQDVAKKNGWSDEQRSMAYQTMGLLSKQEDLLPAQIKQDPLRVLGDVKEVQEPTREGWKTLKNGIKIRKVQ